MRTSATRSPKTELRSLRSGAVYTATSSGGCLRARLSAAERRDLMERFYEPHHAAFTAATGAALVAHGTCLILDGHSFPSQPQPFEPDQTPDRPQICIGTDARHTPSWLRDLAVQVFQEAGYSVEVDRPYAGAIVPLAFYGKNTAVHSLMVELNRSLYMDERTGEKLPGFDAFGVVLSGVLEKVVQRWRESDATAARPG